MGVYTANLLAALGMLPGDEVVPLSHRGCHAPAWLNGKQPRLNRTLWMQFALPAQVTRRGCDMVHLTNSTAPIWGRCPSVVTLHDMTLWLYPHYHYRRRLLAMRPFIPLGLRRAAAIIAVSESTRRDVIRLLGVPAEKVHVVAEAPARHFYPRPAAALAATRKRYGLEGRFVLHVGTLEPRKNLVRLLEAFALLKSGGRAPAALRLLLVGQRGWKDEAIFEAIERLALKDAVQHIGYVPDEDLAALYNLAEALVLPSLYEGFGLPAVEAMASGTPVIASPNGALTETTGGAAETIDPTNVESIAAGMLRVLSDPDRHAQLRAMGLDRAAQFSWTRAAEETRRVYEKAVNGERR